MRAPPAVSVQGAGGRLWAWLCAGLPGVALAAVWAWAAGHGSPQGLGVGGSGLALAAGSALAVWLRVRHAPRAVCLAWDGQRWTLDGAEGHVELMLDAQALLVLRWWSSTAPLKPWHARWLALTAAEAGPRAHLLRAALLWARPQQPAGAPPAVRRGDAE